MRQTLFLLPSSDSVSPAKFTNRTSSDTGALPCAMQLDASTTRCNSLGHGFPRRESRSTYLLLLRSIAVLLERVQLSLQVAPQALHDSLRFTYTTPPPAQRNRCSTQVNHSFGSRATATASQPEALHSQSNRFDAHGHMAGGAFFRSSASTRSDESVISKHTL